MNKGHSFWVNLGILIVSVVFALTCAEIYLRFNPPSSTYMVTRNIVQMTHSEPSSNPRIGYLPKAGLNQDFSNLEFHVHVSINSKNMRDREFSLSKPSGVKRIALVGDSFVFGWGVEADETAAKVLEKKYLKDVEVLNFGVSGYCASQELERVKEHVLRFDPDVLLFFVYGYPGSCQETYVWRNGIMYWGDPPGGKSWKQVIDEYLQRHVYLYSAFWSGFYYAYEELHHFLHPDQVAQYVTDEIPEHSEILGELRQLTAARPMKVVVVYIPVKEELTQGQDPTDVKLVRVLENDCRAFGWGFAHLGAALKKYWIESKQFPYFKHDDHWNRYGQAVTAQTIAEYLKAGKYLESNNFRSDATQYQ